MSSAPTLIAGPPRRRLLEASLPSPHERRDQLGEPVRPDVAETSGARQLLEERQRPARQSPAQLEDRVHPRGHPGGDRDRPDAIVHRVERVVVGEVADPQRQTRGREQDLFPGDGPAQERRVVAGGRLGQRVRRQRRRIVLPLLGGQRGRVEGGQRLLGAKSRSAGGVLPDQHASAREVTEHPAHRHRRAAGLESPPPDDVVGAGPIRDGRRQVGVAEDTKRETEHELVIERVRPVEPLVEGRRQLGGQVRRHNRQDAGGILRARPEDPGGARGRHGRSSGRRPTAVARSARALGARDIAVVARSHEVAAPDMGVSIVRALRPVSGTGIGGATGGDVTRPPG